MNIPQTSDRLDLISSSRSGAGDLTGDPFGYVTGVLAVIIHASYLVLIQKSSLDSEYGPLTAQYAIATMASPVRTVEQGINTAEGRGLIPTEKFLTDFLNASTSLLTFSFFLCSLPPLLSFCFVSTFLALSPCGSRCRSLRCFWCAP